MIKKEDTFIMTPRRAVTRIVNPNASAEGDEKSPETDAPEDYDNSKENIKENVDIQKMPGGGGD